MAFDNEIELHLKHKIINTSIRLCYYLEIETPLAFNCLITWSTSPGVTWLIID